jgi:hypothetical protein
MSKEIRTIRRNVEPDRRVQKHDRGSVEKYDKTDSNLKFALLNFAFMMVAAERDVIKRTECLLVMFPAFKEQIWF